jgi:UDP:flavonoid glycosyltransferase YjiC (YdhE family)
MRLLLLPVGSHGDIHPSIAIAHELARQGHEGIIATNPYYEKLIRGEGLPFEPLGEHLEIAQAAQTPGAMDERLGSLKLMRRLIIPAIPAATKQLLQIATRLKPDAMLMHPLSLGAPSVCEKLSIPYACSNLAPIGWMNPVDRPIFNSWEKDEPPLWMSRAQIALGRFIMSFLLDGPLNRLRRDMGLRPQRGHFIQLCQGGVTNIGLWSRHFRDAIPGDPPTGVICGFPWFDRVRAHDAEQDRLQAFLRDGDPPIIFSLGTAAVHVAGRFYEAAAQACTLLKRRGLLLTAKPEYAPRTLPPGVASFNYAPYSQVFPQCAAIVHHGGIGTTAQSLRAGRPILVTPMSHDQFDNAARIKRLGAGLRLRHASVTPDRLVERLRRLLDEPSFASRARELAPLVAQDDGAVVASRALIKAFAKA